MYAFRICYVNDTGYPSEVFIGAAEIQYALNIFDVQVRPKKDTTITSIERLGVLYLPNSK